MMKGNNRKKSKKLKKDGWLREDLVAQTSLPPQVEGQLRCYLRMSINQILWGIPNAPDVTHVRVQWWGETSEGVIFKPVDVKHSSGEAKTTARYPIRSGPKQFANYLTDLGTLVLEVLSGQMQVPVGRALVENIGQLNPSRPINGFFPVVSADGEKLADLQVSIALESLMASYDSTMSAVPTPDMSIDFYQQQPTVNVHNYAHATAHLQQPLTSAPTPVPAHPVHLPQDDPFSSPMPSKHGPLVGQTMTHVSRIDSRTYGAANPLRDSVHSQQSGGCTSATYSQPSGVSRNTDASHTSQTTLPPYPSSTGSYPQSSSLGNRPSVTPVRSFGVPLAVAKLREQHTRNDGPTSDSQGTLKGLSTLDSQVGSAKSSNEINTSTRVGCSQALSSDLVSVLLERGNKLKEKMIKSTLDLPSSAKDTALAQLGDIFSPLKPDGSTQNLYRDIVNDTEAVAGVKAPRAGVVGVMDSFTDDLDERAVDMVMGAHLTSEHYKVMKALNGSPASSLSLDDQHSDLGDPLHDESILNELFYRDGDGGSDLELEMYTELTEQGTITSVHAAPHQANTRQSRSRQRSQASKRNTSAASMESDGNIRPPSRGSRCSSMSSIILNLEEPSLCMDEKPKKKKKKIRSRSASLERKKKGSKKGTRRSRSRSRGGGSQSDSELIASETSRVSFDDRSMHTEHDPSKTGNNNKAEDTIDGLSVQRLTLLGRVHVARVVIDKLTLEATRSRDSTPVKSKSQNRGSKPPRPTSKKSTYFVEYNFPVVAASRDKYQANAIATEIVRVASKNVNNSIVTFGHRSVFPIQFDADAIDKWWKSALVFKLYCRNPQQKVPKLMGTCSMSLKSVLKSESLYLDRGMDVKDRSRAGSRDRSLDSSRLDDMCPIVANLRVHVELASDSKDFSTALAKTRLAEMTHPLQIIPIVSKPRPEKTPLMTSTIDTKGSLQSKGVEVATEAGIDPRNADTHDIAHLPPPSPRVNRRNSTGSRQASVPITTEYQQVYEPLTLHTLIMIPEGQNITEEGQLASTKHGDSNPSRLPKAASTWSGRDLRTRNLYVNCRMFWCDDASKSNVCWGTFEPKFDFMQVAPVLVSASLLERLRNNLMVVEVWDKKTSAESDQLVGIVKLPLHQFYMSFRERKIANSLLKSQYPVVAVDSDMPILNPFNGQAYGRLRVLLAMGSQEQITRLQNTKAGTANGMMVPERPMHYLERQDLMQDTGNQRVYGVQEHIVEHQFDISIEGIKGLKLLDNMIWGEADCFVQYHFPSQTQLKQQGAPDIVHAAASLKAFRTATTLCVPDPVFNDASRHRLTLHEGSPVQRELLNACAGAGGGPGGIPFEVWCRYYYPNVREQVIAKAQLPLARLCAMVTMQKAGEPSVQSFTLQLQSLATSAHAQQAPKVADSELLELSVTYSSKTLGAQTPAQVAGLARTLPGASTCVSVGVVRACGLQSAAAALALHDDSVQYAAEVGVNTYVRVRLSFLPKEDERITRTVARTFAPDFNFYMDFPTPLLWTEPGSDALSLAEILETAEVTFELWHQIPQTQLNQNQHMQTGSDEITARKLGTTSDVMLGCVNLALIDLLHKKTGLNGWFPVYIPTLGWDTGATLGADSPRTAAALHRVVGGLELSIKFAHGDDLTRVVTAAKGVGWQPNFEIENIPCDDADELNDNHFEVTIALDHAAFPVKNALIAGQSQVDLNARAYLRYKFYDTGAKCSRMCPLSGVSDDMVSVDVSYSKTLHIPGSAPFSWYLAEEKLEVQLWVTHHSDQGSKQRPRNRDKLIGSAFIDLSSLARKGRLRKSHRISDVYPLYKPGASSLGGACLRAHVSLKPVSTALGEDVSLSEDSDIELYPRSKFSPRKGSPTRLSRAERERAFGVHISIERAFHLPIITDDGESQAPNAYVSYQTADKRELTYTAIFPHSSNPVWSHEHDTRLSRDMLVQSAKGLVFKVWHKPTSQGGKPNKGTDKVLGFVSVDLVPLTTGFNMLCGWYNVIDFNGMCQGQIKVSITPQESLVGSAPPIPSVQTIKGSSERFTQFLQTTCARLGTTHLAAQLASQPASTPGPHATQLQCEEQLPHFSEHYESVKRHHEQLNDHMTATGVTDPSAASRSLLFTTLRSQMDDLDKITSTLKQRLVIPSYHSGDGQGHNAYQVNELPGNGNDEHITQCYERDVDEDHSEFGKTHTNTKQMPKTANTGDFLQSNETTHIDPFNHEHFTNAEYRRPENDSSTYSQTLRNAQGILHTADQLIANMNTAARQLAKGDHATASHGGDPSIHVHGVAGGSAASRDALPRPSRAQVHVRFDERSPQMSDELPNYSHYPDQGLSSNTNTDTPHASSEPAIDQEDQLSQPGRWEGAGDGFGTQGWNQYASESEDNDEGAQVIVARPLNDVSSANFANYASLHEEQVRDYHHDKKSQPLHNHSVIEEQDSWFSAHNHTASKAEELYDTINSEEEQAERGDAIHRALVDSDNDIAQNDANREIDFDYPTPTGTVETSEQLLDHLANENPTVLAQVSRTSHGYASTSYKQSAGMAGKSRRVVQRHERGASDSTDSEGVEKVPSSGRPGIAQSQLEDLTSSESEKFAQTNPMLMTQKTIDIPWDKKKSSLLDVAEGFDFQEEEGELSDDIEDVDSPRSSQMGRDSSANSNGHAESDIASHSQPSPRNSNLSGDAAHETSSVHTDIEIEEDDPHSKQGDVTLNDEDNVVPALEGLHQSDSDQDEPDGIARSLPETHDNGTGPHMNSTNGRHSERSSRFSDRSVPNSDRSLPHSHRSLKHSDGSVHHVHSDHSGAQSNRSGARSDRSSVQNKNGNNNGDLPHAHSDTSRELLDISATETPQPCNEVSTVSSQQTSVPRFFPATADLASTMKALRIATHAAKHNAQLEQEKAEAKRKVMESLSVTARLQLNPISAKSRPRPDTQQANRIAKIFQQKFSEN